MKRPPRLVARTLTATFGTVAGTLSAVFIVVTMDARDRVRTAETEKLEIGQRVFAATESRRQQDRLVTASTLAENPTLKAALDTYSAERRVTGLPADQETALRNTVLGEVEKLATLAHADVLAIVDTTGRVFASAGPSRGHWPLHQAIDVLETGQPTFQGVAVLPDGIFHISAVALDLGDRNIGTLVLGTSLDSSYAQELARLSNAGVVVTVAGRVVARTVAEDVAAELTRTGGNRTSSSRLQNEEYVVRTLLASGPARIYALTSIDVATRGATRDAVAVLETIALGGFALAAIGSLWLTRLLTRPIHRLVDAIETMSAARDFGHTIEPLGTSRELDALASAFNELMQGLHDAEAETRATYLGAIRALATALDARDPYTAGHSERVSTLSVLIGRHLQLDDSDLEVIRLGALLHDIGKIGVPDEVLRKPGALTAQEFEQIKFHPTLGARILREVPFLAPYIPIVELHHERPDGRGYPFGLSGETIPLSARIVHVADAFDAMTSSRAYRTAWSRGDAVAELRRCSGTHFDPVAVNALCAALPDTDLAQEPALHELLGRGA